MTRTRSNRGRHRRNRDKAPEMTTPGIEPVTEAPAQPAEPSPVQRSPEPQRPERLAGGEQEPNRRPADSRPEPGIPRERTAAPPRRPPASALPEQPPAQRFGQGRGNRRRQPRRPQSVPMPNQVLKTRAPISGPPGPVEKRRLEDISGPEGPMLGCPMLTRTRLPLPVAGGRPAPRCALAWAVHSETEATYCMETHDLTQCWQAHPERLDEIRERLAERTAAD